MLLEELHDRQPLWRRTSGLLPAAEVNGADQGYCLMQASDWSGRDDWEGD